MTLLQPQGEVLRKAIQWISDQRKESPDKNPITFVDIACIKFDLSPEDSGFLMRFTKNSTQKAESK